MFNRAFLIRLFVGVLLGALMIIAIPAIFGLLGFPASGNMSLFIKCIVVALVILYVFYGG